MKHKETCAFWIGTEFCNRKVPCMAKDLLKNQAVSGGSKNPEGTRPGGPLFLASEWNEFCERTLEKARRANCHELSSLEQKASKLTQRKIDNNELLPDPQRPQDLPNAA